MSVYIQKFRNLEMLKFINVEVYISKTLDVFLNVLSISQSGTHRGTNIKEDEFGALSDMLSTVKWELPEVQEYKDDLALPQFLVQPQLPPSSSHHIVAPTFKPDPAGPCHPEQWVKVQKMVA